MALAGSHYTLTVDILARVAKDLDAYAGLSETPFLSFLEPPSLDGRIVNQYALFAFMSDASVTIDDRLEKVEIGAYKIIVPRRMLWQVRDRLDKANINERLLFPGLAGLAQWLTRYYHRRREGDRDPPGTAP